MRGIFLEIKINTEVVIQKFRFRIEVYLLS